MWSWVNEWLGPLENAAVGGGHGLLDNRRDKKTIRIDRLPAARLGFVGQSHATELEIAIAVTELLRSLDDHLGEGSTNSLGTRSFPDLSGKRHVVLRTNDFPPARDTHRVTARRMGGSIRCYSPGHEAISVESKVEVRSLDSRVFDDLYAFRETNGAIRCDAFPNPLTVHTQGAVLRVSVVDSARTRRRSGLVLKRAHRDRITVLVLPELCLPVGLLEEVRRELRMPLPILVVAGLQHHESDGRWRNRSIVVDQLGRVVHRHDKLTRVDDDGTWECHETGTTIGVVPTPIGAMATPICRDLFHPEWADALRRSAATLVLVPSLSPKTGEHLRAAHSLRLSKCRFDLRGQPMGAERWPGAPGRGTLVCPCASSRPRNRTRADPRRTSRRHQKVKYPSDVSDKG